MITIFHKNCIDNIQAIDISALYIKVICRNCNIFMSEVNSSNALHCTPDINKYFFTLKCRKSRSRFAFPGTVITFKLLTQLHSLRTRTSVTHDWMISAAESSSCRASKHDCPINVALTMMLRHVSVTTRSIILSGQCGCICWSDLSSNLGLHHMHA